MKSWPPIALASAALLLGATIGVRAAETPITPEGREFFEAKIRPVLAAECTECHNAKKTKGGLRLDYRAGWQKGGDTGEAIVPGDPNKGLLISFVRHSGSD